MASIRKSAKVLKSGKKKVFYTITYMNVVQTKGGTKNARHQ